MTETLTPVLDPPSGDGAAVSLRSETGSPGPAVPVGPDAPVMAVMRTMRAMRHLAPDPVPQELLRAIIEAATWAPSAGNWQPAHYLVVTDRSRIRALAPLWGRVIDDFALVLAAAGVDEGESDESHRRTLAATAYQREHFAEIPALVIICESPDAAGPRSRGGGLVWRLLRRGGLRSTLRIVRARADIARSEPASFYPAAENLLLAARAHGLAACFTCWHLLAEAEFKRVLGLPPDVRTWGIVPVGYPLKKFGPVRRRPVDEVIHWERW